MVYLADKDLRPVTDPITFSAVDATARHLEPGGGSVTCAATPQVMAELAVDGRLGVIRHEGEIFLAGPIERPNGAFNWSVSEDVEPGVVQFHIADYLALAAGRRVYPNPAAVWAAQTTVVSHEATGVASTVLRNLVNLNAGPGALVARRVPHLVMGTDPVAGPTLDVSYRFDWLLDAARAIVTRAGGAIGFRTVYNQATRQVTFDVYATVDRSASVRFGRSLGNLRSIQFETEIPKSTTALVAGQGEGTARVMLERTDAAAEAAFWRIENLVDARNEATTDLLEVAGDNDLAEKARTARLGTQTIVTPDLPPPLELLGSLVTVEPRQGLQLVDVVRSVHLQASPRAGSIVTAQVGAQAQSSEPGWLRQSRELARRLSRLESI